MFIKRQLSKQYCSPTNRYEYIDLQPQCRVSIWNWNNKIFHSLPVPYYYSNLVVTNESPPGA